MNLPIPYAPIPYLFQGPPAKAQSWLAQLARAMPAVFEQEPLPVDSPLWAHPKVTVLPHISGPTDLETGAQNCRAKYCALSGKRADSGWRG